MVKSMAADRIELGVCYYPEQWEEKLWEDDFRRMRELGFQYIRIAEFAWAIFEPEEGVFQFDLFDRALNAAHHWGLKVIMGTPTATPPAWLTQKYPEVLNVSQNGIQYQHGARRHYNYNTAIYRKLCARIVSKMGEHFKDHPSIIGWQIDNELNCELDVFYSEADHIAFRVWLEQKYKSLTAMNEAWGTVFWSQTYSSWEQVHLTRPTVSSSPNPHQALDEKRFFSDSTIEFAKIQVDILRDIVGTKHWITTNGLFGHIDNSRLTDDLLDFYSYDSYPQFSTIFPDVESEPLNDRKWSLNLSKVRDISPNFCIMEQQSGPGGWVNRFEMPSPRPGQMRLWTYQSIAHGADLVLFFRWRTATFGTEIYWHGINDYHNLPNRRVKEVAQIGQELGMVGSMLAQTRYSAEIAIVCDNDNLWDGEFDVWHGPLTARSTLAWFKTLQRKHIPTDVLTLNERTTLNDLKAYRVLVYPHPAILEKAAVDLLQAYAEAGGIILFGARTGYKDIRGHCLMMPLPGYAASLCGVTVEDFTLIKGNVMVPKLKWVETGVGIEDTEPVMAELFNDILQVADENVQVLAVYDSEYYAGKPALTVKKVGSGRVYYYGAAYSESVVSKLLPELGLKRASEDLVTAPPEVELAVRKHQQTGKSYTFALNYSDKAAILQILTKTIDLLSGVELYGQVALEPYGVMLLSQ